MTDAHVNRPLPTGACMRNLHGQYLRERSRKASYFCSSQVTTRVIPHIIDIFRAFHYSCLTSLELSHTRFMVTKLRISTTYHQIVAGVMGLQAVGSPSDTERGETWNIRYTALAGHETIHSKLQTSRHMSLRSLGSTRKHVDLQVSSQALVMPRN